jgi:hypothetical protein
VPQTLMEIWDARTFESIDLLPSDLETPLRDYRGRAYN